MTFANPHLRSGRPGSVQDKGLIAQAHERKGFALDLVMLRLFLSALAGLLAIHFWRTSRR